MPGIAGSGGIHAQVPRRTNTSGMLTPKALKPTRLDISETVRWLGYRPAYSLANLLSELAEFGDGGPPYFTRS